jgi:hypothetical protein
VGASRVFLRVLFELFCAVFASSGLPDVGVAVLEFWRDLLRVSVSAGEDVSNTSLLRFRQVSQAFCVKHLPVALVVFEAGGSNTSEWRNKHLSVSGASSERGVYEKIVRWKFALQ